MSVDLKALINNKKVQYGGIAGAAGLGAFVWYRKKHASPATSAAAASSDGSDSTTPASYTPGSFPDTSGTDTAAWLGQNESAFLQELDQYLATVQQTSPPPSTTPSPTPSTPTPHPTTPVIIRAPGGPVKTATPIKATTGNPAAKKQTVTVKTYTKTNTSPLSTLSGIVGVAKSKYGITTSVAQLEKLNGLKSTVIHPNEQLKLN